MTTRMIISSSSFLPLIHRQTSKQILGKRYNVRQIIITSSTTQHQQSYGSYHCQFVSSSYFSSKAGGFQQQQIIIQGDDDDDDINDKIKITTTKPIAREEEDQPELKSRLDVAIVGYPNAGKSQLLNALIGTKVAAVSRKRHTTRNGIMGVLTGGTEPEEAADKQIVFCDTPGFMTELPRGDQNQKDLVLSAKGYMMDVDYTLLVIDAAKTKMDRTYLNTITTLMWNAMHTTSGSDDNDGKNSNVSKSKSKFGIVLNKVDLIKPKKKLLEAAQFFGNMADMLLLEKMKLTTDGGVGGEDNNALLLVEELMPDVFYTCAKNGKKDEGIQDLLNHLYDISIPNREWMIDDDDNDGAAGTTTPMDYPARVEEIIREKIYRTLHRELPHQIRQRNRQMELIRGDSGEASIMMIQQDLLVRTKSHLKVVNGSGNLQRIHDSAVPELRRLFQCEVLLTLKAKLISRNNRR